MSEHLDLADWRRRMAALYQAQRADRRAEPARLVAFRAGRDRLFAEHSQSPIPAAERRNFRGLAYWRHDPALRYAARLEPDLAAAPLDVPRSGSGAVIPFSRIGWVRVAIGSTPVRLAVYWLNEYAGGLFLPFRDATNGVETYGGGRYLLDSAKGADLGSEGDQLVIDFNYAYHPSCAYDPRWSCPLAPAENWLNVPVRAGERLAPEPRGHAR